MARARSGSAGLSLILALALASACSLAGPAQPMSVLGKEVQAGGRLRTDLDYGPAFLGDRHTTPVIVTHGLIKGPTLCLTAAVHGDEINGVEVIRQMLVRTDAAKLSGTLIVIPAVNWLAFMQGSRETPERRDINRYFPGDPQDDYASRLTHALFERVLKPHCDYLVDLHTASLKRSNVPQLRADLGDPEVRRFAALLNELPILWEDGSRRMLRQVAARAGIKAVAVEFGSAETI
ncbi:MAG: succinylglutamate desuccinylase/aspartoacylase family protein [Gammaproteobacteria bacterium]|nr:succinylglutamate desuccinylase/aspartoacylase family protein [Gammaproteobacteria bacterium]